MATGRTGQLEALIRKGKSSARQKTRARILLKADAGMAARDFERAVDVSAETIYQVRQRFVEGGLEAALNEKPRPETEADGQVMRPRDRACWQCCAAGT